MSYLVDDSIDIGAKPSTIGHIQTFFEKECDLALRGTFAQLATKSPRKMSFMLQILILLFEEEEENIALIVAGIIAKKTVAKKAVLATDFLLALEKSLSAFKLL